MARERAIHSHCGVVDEVHDRSQPVVHVQLTVANVPGRVEDQFQGLLLDDLKLLHVCNHVDYSSVRRRQSLCITSTCSQKKVCLDSLTKGRYSCAETALARLAQQSMREDQVKGGAQVLRLRTPEYRTTKHGAIAGVTLRMFRHPDGCALVRVDFDPPGSKPILVLFDHCLQITCYEVSHGRTQLPNTSVSSSYNANFVLGVIGRFLTKMSLSTN